MESIIPLLLLLLLPLSDGFLNIEELNDMKYSLDIMDKPLNSIEINNLDGMKLASRHGQDYYCKLPVKALKAAGSAEDEGDRIPKETPISVLLEPLRKQECLKLIKGWWTYEFCYGTHVKQYRSEDGSLVGETMYLGFYESDFDWKNKEGDQTSQLRRHRLQRYHSQKYVNGTQCDLIHHQRDTEIRFTCDDSSMETYITRVDEPSTCSYVITIATPYICSHPYTRPMPSRKPSTIQCHPVLPPDQFVEYEKMAEADTASLLKNYGEHVQLRTQLTSVIEQHKQLLLSNAMTEAGHPLPLAPEQDFIEEEATATDEKEKFLGDLDEFLGTVMEKDKAQKILKKFHKDRELKKRREEVRNQAISMIERFIVEERLQKISTIKQNLLVMNVIDLMLQNRHLPTADVARIIELYVTKYVETEEQFRGEEQKYDRMSRQLDRKLFELGILQENVETPEDNEDSDPVLKVKLKVKKLKTLDDLTSISSEEVMSDDFEEVSRDPAWRKLEEELGRGLENAGVGGIGGGEIEIRIITNQDVELGLGEADGNRFSNILLDMLGGSAARIKETKRQKKLVINYNRIWKKDTSTFEVSEDIENDNDEENSVL